MKSNSAPSPGARAPQAPLCFVHIPKTAGATLKSLLSRAYTTGANAGNWLSNAARAQEKLARLQRFPDRVLMGHVPYALYRSNVAEGARYITLLRETVDRVISHYFRHIHGRKFRGNIQLRSITQALELGLPELTNLSTRFLCANPSGDLSADALDEAKRNLRHFTFVGLQERFDESVILLHQALGLDHLVCYGPSRHVNESRPSTDAISDAERLLILERNALDVELYKYARDLFDELAGAADESLSANIERLREMRAPLVADHAAKRGAAASWLERVLPAGTTRSLPGLRAEAAAAGLDTTAIREEIQAMRGGKKAVVLALDDDSRLISTDSRFLAISNTPVLFLNPDESRAILTERGLHNS